MTIVYLSDTHNRHDDVLLPLGDVLIHAGDISSRGKYFEIKAFLEWFSAQPHKYKIFIAGNHDFFFEQADYSIIKNEIPENVIYLNDSGCEIEGVKIWGSPIQPEFFNWAFNRERGEDIKKHWDLIPSDTDILVTHGPPFGILDQTIRGKSVGCEELLKKVLAIKPRIHVFGHIHEAYGIKEDKGTTFINASLLNHKYYFINDPIVLEIKTS